MTIEDTKYDWSDAVYILLCASMPKIYVLSYSFEVRIVVSNESSVCFGGLVLKYQILREEILCHPVEAIFSFPYRFRRELVQVVTV